MPFRSRNRGLLRAGSGPAGRRADWIFTQVFLDTWDRANGSLGSNWTGNTSSPDYAIVSNVVQCGGPFEKQILYATSLGANHYSDVIVNARITNRSGPGPCVRDGNYMGYHDGSSWKIAFPNSFTIIASFAEALPALPFNMRLAAKGSAVRLYYFNGTSWVLKCEALGVTNTTQTGAGVRYDRVSTEGVINDVAVGTVA